MEAIIKKIEQQEEKLVLEHFDNLDAWKLGNELVKIGLEEKLPIAISIRKTSGQTLFEYACPGTTIDNCDWMRRKFNTVLQTERSTLHLWAKVEAEGDATNKSHVWFTHEEDYVICGGGFPIVVKGVGMVAVALVSGLPHEEDHAVLVRGFEKFAGIEE